MLRSPIGTGALAAIAVVMGLWPLRPLPSRRPPHRPPNRARRGWLQAVGQVGARWMGPPPSDAAARWRGGIALGAAAALVISAPLAPLVLAVGWMRERSEVRRRNLMLERAVVGQLPEIVDLIALCIGAGLSLPLAHVQLAGRASGPLGDALLEAAAAADGGASRADALVGALSPLGDRASALAHVLADHLRYGTPLLPGLERIGLELRLDRRRRAEVEARRVPVRLLGPLVTCVLPAFGLLTVVPLLAASFRSLPT